MSEPGPIYLALKVVHIVATGLLVGVLVAWPILPVRAPGSEAERVAAGRILGYLHRATKWFVVPAVVLLFVTGFLMLVPPVTIWEPFESDGRWIILGMVAWVGIAGVAGGFLLGLARELHETVLGDGRRSVETVWRQWRAGALAAALLTFAAIWVMVYKPPF